MEIGTQHEANEGIADKQKWQQWMCSGQNSCQAPKEENPPKRNYEF